MNWKNVFKTLTPFFTFFFSFFRNCKMCVADTGWNVAFHSIFITSVVLSQCSWQEQVKFVATLSCGSYCLMCSYKKYRTAIGLGISHYYHIMSQGNHPLPKNMTYSLSNNYIPVASSTFLNPQEMMSKIFSKIDTVTQSLAQQNDWSCPNNVFHWHYHLRSKDLKLSRYHTLLPKHLSYSDCYSDQSCELALLLLERTFWVETFLFILKEASSSTITLNRKRLFWHCSQNSVQNHHFSTNGKWSFC